MITPKNLFIGGCLGQVGLLIIFLTIVYFVICAFLGWFSQTKLGTEAQAITSEWLSTTPADSMITETP